jgi:ribosome-binding factor A
MTKSSPHNKERLINSILNETNTIIRGLSDTRLQFVSITKVELNKDKSMATLYWDTFDSSKRGDIKKGLEASVAKIRTLLAGKLGMRAMPQLRLVYDGQFEAESHITKILESESHRGESDSDSNDPSGE